MGQELILLYKVELYGYILLFAAACCFVAFNFALLFRKKEGSTWLLLTLISAMGWATMAGLATLDKELPDRIIWSYFEYPFLICASAFMLRFLIHLKKEKQKLWLDLFLWGPPFLMFLVLITDPLTHLLWSSVVPSKINDYDILVYNHGPAFYFYGLYVNLHLVYGLRLLFKNKEKILSKSEQFLVIGMIFPWVTGLLYVFKLAPRGFDLSPVGFAGTGICLTYAIWKYKLLDPENIAKSLLYQVMPTGMIILNTEKELVRHNPATLKLLNFHQERAKQEFQNLLAQQKILIPDANTYKDYQAETKELYINNLTLLYQVHHIVNNLNQHKGFLITLTDVTKERVLLNNMKQSVFSISADIALQKKKPVFIKV